MPETPASADNRAMPALPRRPLPRRLLLLLLALAGMALHARTPAPAPAPAPTPQALLVLHDAGHQLTLQGGADGPSGARLQAATPLVGAPQIAAQARHAYWATQDGGVVQITLPALEQVAHAPVCQAGAPLLALSGDGHWLLAACTEEGRAQIFDAALQPVRAIDIATLDGRRRSGAAQLLALPERRSWLLAPAALDELWEISHDRNAAPIFDGLVHDYRMGEAIASSGFLGVRRTPLASPLANVMVPPGSRFVVGAERCAPPAPCRVRVLHLDARSQVAGWSLSGAPRPDASALWTRQGQAVLALAGTAAAPTLIGLQRWQPLEHAALPVPAQHIALQPGSERLWLQTPSGPWAIVDARTLHTLATLDAGQPTSLAFTRDGRGALLVQAGAKGWLTVYDALTLAPLQRLPFAGLRGAWPLALIA